MVPNEEIGASYFALSINKNSPFKYYPSGSLFFQERLVGVADSLEEDTCTDTYFRKNKAAITLNSNSRSNCKGCRFCGTYSLTSEEQDLTSEKNLEKKIKSLMADGKFSDFSGFSNMGVVTGCFGSEAETLNHLLMLKRVFSQYGYDGEIAYIGSQIRSKGVIDRLAKEGNYGLYLTVECFERRNEIMKPTKASLQLEQGRNVLDYAKNNGLNTSFLYIMGLDSLESIKTEFPKYVDVLTRHPVINLMQNYVPEHEKLRSAEARNMDYYFKARTIIEDIFKNTDLRPRLWENYRSPWFKNYAGEKIDGERI
jgi:hypothetical protein